MSKEHNLDPDRLALQQLNEQLAGIPNQSERLQMSTAIGEMAIDLAMSEAYQENADRDIEALKAMATVRASKKEAKVEDTITVIDAAKIGWINSEEKFEVALEKNDGFWFADLTTESRITENAVEHLEREGVLHKLLASLKETVVPKVLHNIKHGGADVRSVSLGSPNRRNTGATEAVINTTYPAYKADVHGTANRAILLLAGEHEGVPIVALAAIYDHEMQHKVFNVISYKAARHKK